MKARDNRGVYFVAEITAPLLVRKARTRRSLAVSKGNATRASNRRKAALAMFGIYL